MIPNKSTQFRCSREDAEELVKVYVHTEESKTAFEKGKVTREYLGLQFIVLPDLETHS